MAKITKTEPNPFTPIHSAFVSYRDAKKRDSIVSKALSKKLVELKSFIAATTEIKKKEELTAYSKGIEKLSLEVDALKTQNESAQNSLTETKTRLSESIYFPNIKFPTSIHGHSWVMKTDDGSISYKNEKKDGGKLIPVKRNTRKKPMKFDKAS